MSVREALVDEAVDSIKEMIDEAIVVIVDTDALTEAERRAIYDGLRSVCALRIEQSRRGG